MFAAVNYSQRFRTLRCRLQGCIDGAAHWRGHRVWVMDGTGCSMPDTQDLQKAFSQPPMQKACCGFPVAHLLALFHVGTGMLVRVVAAPLRTGDMALAKFVHGELQSGDIVLADRAFGSFGHLAALAAMGAHGVCRIQQTRAVSFRQGRPPNSQGSHQSKRWSVPSRRWIKRLGHHDQIVEYIKPRVCPSWLTHEEWSRFPSSLRVREVRYSLTATGYRSRSVTLVTTLLDADRYPKQAITDPKTTAQKLSSDETTAGCAHASPLGQRSINFPPFAGGASAHGAVHRAAAEARSYTHSAAGKRQNWPLRPCLTEATP